MRDLLYRIARRLYPGLDSFNDAERGAAAGYVIRIAAFLPFSLIGLIWLATVTELTVLRAHALFLVGLFGFMVLLGQLWLQTYYETEAGGYRSERRSFWGEALWAGVLVLGPSAAWLGVALPLLTYAYLRGRTAARLRRLRILSQSVFRTSVLLPTLVEVSVYRQLGGTFPLPGLAPSEALPAVVATLAGFSLGSMMIAGANGLIRVMSPPSPAGPARQSMRLRFSALMILIGPVAGLVAIFPAGLYSLAGPGAFFAFLGMLVGAVFVTDQLGRSIESDRRRTRELEQLEHLSRAIIQSAPDVAVLPGLLQTYVPRMFPTSRVAIRLAPEWMLLMHPPHWPGPDPAMWRWEPDATGRHSFPPGTSRPWAEDAPRGGTLLLPIVEAQGSRVIGRIYVHSEEHDHTVDQLIPATQSLAAQIASALFSVDVHQQTLAERLARQRAEQELALGAQVQASFLPDATPHVAGWEITAVLESARETSGDFYDFIPFDDGRIGVVVADVTDKGLGAAFYMALSRTLLRTYAVDFAARFPSDYMQRLPDVLAAMNGRIEQDASNDMFVTLFYGVIDPTTGTLTYANAGHNPPYLFHRGDEEEVTALAGTGLPVGAFNDAVWRWGSAQIDMGDVLVLYTDGLTEVEDASGAAFGEERLQRIVLDNLGHPAQHTCDALLAAAHDHAAGAVPFDDITLVVIRRG